MTETKAAASESKGDAKSASSSELPFRCVSDDELWTLHQDAVERIHNKLKLNEGAAGALLAQFKFDEAALLAAWDPLHPGKV
jgi:hypothetical protein